ncbi:hypothetical protein QE197_13620 [Arsenophonus nasoniae]|uniref:Uncharacterized protein n=1 Tax=Arsenophonus nasoniae TaxID=638 RepID=D2TXM6_9GAMM|nr:hypothetical protein [Arsenophonus nasoniae]QBY44530.1 hypothetical protein ArsFIN_31160 [Arsenophonus nasoniae]WGM04788.1 hypothetical protein QE258_14450 [Arsenophonus nasoniae]WGM09888.1 hypothetical protein QE197_13620 [Arsenophonus nasoniae]WGM14607.1 hypothetical protein QE193_13525 [Arsenophonus nasoniae]CBA72146.1 hypothetical protein ARN_08540 [Arsenophonus nasoniae]
MNINNDFYHYNFEITQQPTDNNQIMATTDNIAIKKQKILFNGLIRNLSQHTHQIDKDE